MSKHCLNCNTSLHGKYCNNCGQKADTHRITAKHFLAHDLLHGMFHIEKGLFYTILQIAKRGGATAKEYIAGKRVSYYNVFYLSLILLGFNILLSVTKHNMHPETELVESGSIGQFFNYLTKNVKIIVLALIPILGFNTWLIFRKLKYNFAEHLVAAGFCLVGCLSFEAFSSFVDLFNPENSEVFVVINFVLVLLMLLIPLFFYYNFARPTITRLGYSWRILVFYFLFAIELIMLLLLLVYLSTGDLNLEGELRV